MKRIILLFIFMHFALYAKCLNRLDIMYKNYKIYREVLKKDNKCIIGSDSVLFNTNTKNNYKIKGFAIGIKKISLNIKNNSELLEIDTIEGAHMQRIYFYIIKNNKLLKISNDLLSSEYMMPSTYIDEYNGILEVYVKYLDKINKKYVIKENGLYYNPKEGNFSYKYQGKIIKWIME